MPKTRQRKADDQNRSESFGALDPGVAKIETLALDEEGSPSNKADAFRKAAYYRRHWFVDGVLALRQGFCNFGCTIKARRREDSAKLKEFMEAQPDDWTESIHDYVDEVWHGWLTFGNVISFWRGRSTRPILLDLGTVTYSDRFGTAVLKVPHGLKSDEIDRLEGWSKTEKDRLRKGPVIEIRSDDDDFHFKVGKSAKLGDGLGWPPIKGLFETLNFSQSLEVGDSVRAFGTRKVYEQHKMGHEIKAGQKAGDPAHFFKKPKGDAWAKFIKGKTGYVSFSGNFDHEVTFPFMDPKSFAAARYESAVERMMWWSAPVGQMIQARGVTPYLMDLLRQQCLPAREKIGRHLAATLNEGFDFPVPVRVQWSNRCFRDTRLATELLKFGLQNGPFSQATYIEETGGDPDVERERKQEESKLPKVQTLPLFDASHGSEPASGSGGRPAGSPDPTGG
jgi:hypothetical protein